MTIPAEWFLLLCKNPPKVQRSVSRQKENCYSRTIPSGLWNLAGSESVSGHHLQYNLCFGRILSLLSLCICAPGSTDMVGQGWHGRRLGRCSHNLVVVPADSIWVWAGYTRFQTKPPEKLYLIYLFLIFTHLFTEIRYLGKRIPTQKKKPPPQSRPLDPLVPTVYLPNLIFSLPAPVGRVDSWYRMNPSSPPHKRWVTFYTEDVSFTGGAPPSEEAGKLTEGLSPRL